MFTYFYYKLKVNLKAPSIATFSTTMTKSASKNNNSIINNTCYS